MTTTYSQTTYTIAGIKCERVPKTPDEKLRKIEALAHIPEQAFARMKRDDLREFAKGIITQPKARKEVLVEKLISITRDKRNELATRAAQAVADLSSMQINIEDIALLLNTCDDPSEVAGLVYANFATRFAPSTISKRITPALTKLISNNPHIDPEKAVVFKRHWLDLVRPATTTINKNYSEAVADQHRNLEETNEEQIISFIEVTLLAAKNGQPVYWAAVVLALVGATGRRPCEILSTKSSFSPIQGEPNMLLFDGQAKTKNRQDVGAYTIPTLVEAELCLAGLQWLEDNGKRIDCKHGEVNGRFSKSLSTNLPKELKEKLASIGLHKPYEFRHFYACYLNELFNQCPNRPRVSSRAFLSRLLGHGANDISTSSSYESKRVRLTLSPDEQEELTALWYKIFSC
jgi:integrase